MLGQSGKFYNISNTEELGSASYSILSNTPENTCIRELLIDAGHNTVPFLLQHGNRMPDAIALTHGHPDHILGVDWIIQSHRFGHAKADRYPVYCTRGTWGCLMNSYTHIKPWVDFRELIPGKQMRIHEFEELFITAFPVYHGDGAPGSSMLLIESGRPDQGSVLFTGDMLCPLLRKKDLKTISGATKLFIDTNNRFPDPLSNHISFTPYAPGSGKESELLTAWFRESNPGRLLKPHTDPGDIISDPYFNEFLSDYDQVSELPHSILDFCKLSGIPEVFLIHYFGWYDQRNYSQQVLTREQLFEWATREAGDYTIKDIIFRIPVAGEIINF